MVPLCDVDGSAVPEVLPAPNGPQALHQAGHTSIQNLKWLTVGIQWYFVCGLVLL